MSEIISIKEAAKLLGVSVSTLRIWDKDNKLKPIIKTFGKHRRYDKQQILNLFNEQLWK